MTVTTLTANSLPLKKREIPCRRLAVRDFLFDLKVFFIYGADYKTYNYDNQIINLKTIMAYGKFN